MILSQLGFVSFGEKNSSLKYIEMTTDQLPSLPLFIPFPPSLISCCPLHTFIWKPITGQLDPRKMRADSRDPISSH